MSRSSSIQVADNIRLLIVIAIAAAAVTAPLAASGSVPSRSGGAATTRTSSDHAMVGGWTRGDFVTHRAIVPDTSSPMLQTTAAVGAPWAEQDIGSPALAGSSTQNGSVFTVSGSGADIWGTSDQFHFVYQPLTGDGDLIARVDSLSTSNAWVKAGVMIRESLTAGSTHAFALVSAGHGSAFQRRIVTGGSTYHTTGAFVRAPFWVRLVRIGNTFSAYQSSNGTVWQLISSQSIPMATTVFAGLAVSSHDTSSLATGTFSNVALNAGSFNQLPSVQLTAPAAGASFTAPASITLTANATDADGSIASVSFVASGKTIGSAATAPYTVTWTNVPTGSYVLSAVATDNTGATVASSTRTISVTDPVGALPAPWTAQDIGSPALAGRSGATTSGFTVEGAGTDIFYSADQFQFMSQPLTGDGQIVARVDSLVNTSSWAKAGVMIRESTAAGSTHAFAVVSAGKGIAFQRRTVTGGASANTAGTTSTAPRWVKVARQGNTFSAYESGDGTNWTLIGSDTISMATTVLAGLAVTSHNANALTTAVFSNVTVTPAGANQPPSVALTSPANGATFTAPATITVSANASDADGTVTKVDFYQGSSLIGTATTSPYSVTWNNVGAGTYTLTAVATDDAGATTTSAGVNVTVGGSNRPPSVAITSPAGGFSFGAPAVVALSASASDPDGTIAKVDFYAGATLVGSVRSAPFSLAWNVLSPGAYTLTAVATDNLGAATTSAPVAITANPSRAAFTASADHDTLVTSYRLDIFAAGANPTTATPVASQNLGKPTPVSGTITVDITTTLQPLAPGSYLATVSAVGAAGSSQSAAVSFVR